MIFHVLSVPIYPTRKEITLCAFTQKVYKFCTEMTKRGHTVFHYGHPDSDVNCTKHFDVVSRKTYNKVYGKQSWKEFHNQNVDNEVHNEFNKNASKLIQKNKQSESDLVLAFWGFGHANCCNQLKDFIIVEPSVGYDSGFAPFKVFESYAQLHKLQHQLYKNNIPSFGDAVIPPGFYFDDFIYEKQKNDYMLFLGRMVDAKGIILAQEVSKILNLPIKFVGPQNMKNNLVKDNPRAEYIHTVSFDERKNFLAKARCLIMPSLYSEPCGWTMIESFISGTPVISTDWGGMSEYNIHRKTGFRCRSLNEFVHAVNQSAQIRPQDCRKHAEDNFAISDIMATYERYFSSVVNLKKYQGPNYVLEKCDFIVK